MKQPVDFIIIGSGIAGLYAAYQIKRISHHPPPTRHLLFNSAYMSSSMIYIIVPNTGKRVRYSIIFIILFRYNKNYTHSASASAIQPTTPATARSNSDIRICGNSVCASQKYLQYDHLKSSLSQ